MLVEPEFSDLVRLARVLRPIDRMELAVTRNVRDYCGLATSAMEEQAYGQLAKVNGKPAFAFGATLAGLTTVQVWAFGSRQAPKALKTVTKHVKRIMIPYLLSHGVREARAVSHPLNIKAHRWLEYFGFKLTATIPGLGPRSEDMLLFVVTADELRGSR